MLPLPYTLSRESAPSSVRVVIFDEEKRPRQENRDGLLWPHRALGVPVWATVPGLADLWVAGEPVLPRVWNSLWRNLVTSIVLPWTWDGPCYKPGSQNLWEQNSTFDCNPPLPTKAHYLRMSDRRQTSSAWSPLLWLCWDWAVPGGKCNRAMYAGSNIHPVWKIAECYTQRSHHELIFPICNCAYWCYEGKAVIQATKGHLYLTQRYTIYLFIKKILSITVRKRVNWFKCSGKHFEIMYQKA